tara:strand:+ start:5 stop:625 length:621 start_codon:yes stop_codon:yes gene_type:complete
MEDIKLIHGDSLQALKGYADNHFDWAIVDPPYGIDIAKWDAIDMKPPKEYFDELMRVSKNQIIWGANYFHLPHSQAWICWHKTAGFTNRAFSGASDFELAWTSTDGKARLLPLTCSGNIIGINGGRPNYNYKPIHPTQKPVELYKILLEDYTSEGDLILDTHLGSGSIAIACHYMKRKLIGYEIDKEYYNSACKRFKEQTMQQALW